MRHKPSSRRASRSGCVAPQTGMEDAIWDIVVLLLSDNDQTMRRTDSSNQNLPLYCTLKMYVGRNVYVSNFVLNVYCLQYQLLCLIVLFICNVTLCWFRSDEQNCHRANIGLINMRSRFSNIFRWKACTYNSDKHIAIGPMRNRRWPDEVIQRRADVVPISKSVVGPM